MKPVRAVLPAGKYYIGDPCYVFTHEDWGARIMPAMYPGNNEVEGETKVDGVAFFQASTYYGDGSYIGFGSKAFSYTVDAGILGAVPVGIMTRPEDYYKDLGTVIETETTLTCERDENGEFTFRGWNSTDGRIEITIETNSTKEDEDDDYGDYWGDEDDED